MVQSRSGYIAVPGAQLYYEDSGAIGKTAMLFLHAGIADRRMWEPQADYFSRDYRVVRYDARGFGKTNSEDVEYSPRADAIAVLDHLGVDTAVISGCSLGGMTAIDLAIEYPDRVQALVPVCAGLGGFNFQPDEGDMHSATGRLFMQMEEAEQSKSFERLIALEVHLWADGGEQPEGRAPAHVREKMRDMISNAQQRAQPEGRVALLQPPAADRLNEIKIPTLVIVGELDTRAILLMADAMAQGIPHAQKVVIENAAHVPSMEWSDLFNQHLADFLKAHNL